MIANWFKVQLVDAQKTLYSNIRLRAERITMLCNRLDHPELSADTVKNMRGIAESIKDINEYMIEFKKIEDEIVDLHNRLYDKENKL